MSDMMSPKSSVAGSETTKVNMEAGMPKKKLSVPSDDDAISEDFFTERTNRYVTLTKFTTKICLKMPLISYLV